MPMTATQRRAADAERKRRQRRAARAEGRPSADRIYHAIAEACSFALLVADRRVWIESAGWLPVNIKVIIDAAVDILVDFGFDGSASKKAVVAILRPRVTHGQFGNIPSKFPHARQSSYEAFAPEAAIPSAAPGRTPPLPPQDGSSTSHATGHGE
jgi:hypothetical protein